MSSLKSTLKSLMPKSVYSFLLSLKHQTQRFNLKKNEFGYYDATARVDLPIYITHRHNVFVHKNSYIGANSTIFCALAKFILKEGSGSAGNLTVVTGNHQRIVGKFHRQITNADKSADMDKDVIVNEDVWMGLNVTLLSGVEIGRGSTIASGAVVTKSMPPYAIIGGVPAKVLKFYWTIDEILAHEKKLYPENQRFTREQLSLYMNAYQTSHK